MKDFSKHIDAARFILEHYGEKKQEIQAVQELSELILLFAARPDQRKDDYKQHVTEEIADSILMIEQIRLANDIPVEDVFKTIDKKIERQFGRIEKEAKA